MDVDGHVGRDGPRPLDGQVDEEAVVDRAEGLGPQVGQRLQPGARPGGEDDRR
jgi:hypothetical protein